MVMQAILKTDQTIVVDAWQFVPNAARPVWVFRKFHDLYGDGELHAVGLDAPVKTGDWLLRQSNEIVVISDDEFKRLFKIVEYQSIDKK